jgi:hypothetical protein
MGVKQKTLGHSKAIKPVFCLEVPKKIRSNASQARGVLRPQGPNSSQINVLQRTGLSLTKKIISQGTPDVKKKPAVAFPHFLHVLKKEV